MQLYPSATAGSMPQQYHQYHHLNPGHLHQQQQPALPHAQQLENTIESTPNSNGLLQHHMPLPAGHSCRSLPPHVQFPFTDFDRSFPVDFDGSGSSVRPGTSATAAAAALQASISSALHPTGESTLFQRAAASSLQPSAFATGTANSGEWFSGNVGSGGGGGGSGGNNGWYFDATVDGVNGGRNLRFCDPASMSATAARQYAAYLQAAAGYGSLSTSASHRLYSNSDDDDVTASSTSVAHEKSPITADNATNRLSTAAATAVCGTSASGGRQATSAFPLSSSPSAAASAPGGRLPVPPPLIDSRTATATSSTSERQGMAADVEQTTCPWQDDENIGNRQRLHSAMPAASLSAAASTPYLSAENELSTSHPQQSHGDVVVRCQGNDRQPPEDRNNNAVVESSEMGDSGAAAAAADVKSKTTGDDFSEQPTSRLVTAKMMVKAESSANGRASVDKQLTTSSIQSDSDDESDATGSEDEEVSAQIRVHACDSESCNFSMPAAALIKSEKTPLCNLLENSCLKMARTRCGRQQKIVHPSNTHPMHMLHIYVFYTIFMHTKLYSAVRRSSCLAKAPACSFRGTSFALCFFVIRTSMRVKFVLRKMLTVQ
jgi:hypothetical protein